jgi:predicted TIM-barrel fold metal-dependent hydrolase
MPIIDTHIHLFDVSRPQGVPWPPQDSSIYHSALPAGYRKLTAPHGITGAIAIECSPWPADNQWLLDTAAQDPIIMGVIGNLVPGEPGFGKQLDHLAANPLFRGIRCGNLWNRDLARDLSNPGFLADLKLISAAGLVLDTANPNPALMHAAVRLTDAVPNLTLILDHLPALRIPDDPDARQACETDLQLLAARPNVFAKISAIVQRVDGRVPLDLAFYRSRLDHLWQIFGSDRLFYGSDWPNSAQWASYDDVFRLAHEFIATKDHATREKFYSANAQKAYRLRAA